MSRFVDFWPFFPYKTVGKSLFSVQPFFIFKSEFWGTISSLELIFVMLVFLRSSIRKLGLIPRHSTYTDPFFRNIHISNEFVTLSTSMAPNHKLIENYQRGDPLILDHIFIRIIKKHNENQANLHFREILIWNLEIVKCLKGLKGGPFDFGSCFQWNH